MHLFFAPDYSSLATHISLLEAGIPFDLAHVDLETKRLADGRDYHTINPKGMVPALLFDDGQLLTENIAILAWVAERAPALMPTGARGRDRLLEMLAFIATEIHKRFPILMALDEDAREPVARDITRWFDVLAPKVEDAHLFGEAFSAADAYLFVLARGAIAQAFPLNEPLRAYVKRVEARATVQAAIARETSVSASSRPTDT